MSFVIYNKKNFRLWADVRQYGHKEYKTEAAAKAQLTRLTKGLRAVLKEEDWTVASWEDFSKLEPTVTVQSLMTGKDVQLKKHEVGGCCDPSTERFWCM